MREGIEPNPGPMKAHLQHHAKMYAHVPKTTPPQPPRPPDASSPRAPPPSLRCITFNCNGLTDNRQAELERGIAEFDPDVVLLQELKTAQLNGVHVSGYRTFLRKRAVKRSTGKLESGGGIATLVRDSISAKVVHSSMRVTERLDVRCCGRRGKHVTIVNVYRPGGVGKAAKDKRVDDFCAEDLPRGHNVFIAGDFNLHHPAWNVLAKEPGPGGADLMSWMERSDMKCWNDPTVLTYASGRGRSSPDLVISSSEHPTDSWQVLDPWGSDHCPVLFDVPFPGFRQPEPKAQKRWAWHLADWAGFRAEVDAFSTKVLRWQDPHESANRFASAVKKAAKRHIGYCSNKARSKGWWSKPVAEAISARNNEARRQRSLASISTADATLLTDLRRGAKEAIDEAKRVQLEKLLSSSTSGNPKPMFDFLRRADGRGAKRAAVNLSVDGVPLTSPYDKAKELGKYYATVCGDGEPAPRNPVRLPAAPARDPASLLPSEGDLTATELETALLCLSPGNSAGPDGIPTTLLTNLGYLSRRALLHLMNLSWRSGVVPHNWKRALLTPLPKPGKDATICSSYRPIALTSNVCKVLERILKARLSHLFADPGSGVTALCGSQAGFQRLRSTTEQVALFAQSVSDAQRGGKFAVALFFDMEKAFDTVSKEAVHRRLEDLCVPLRFRVWIRAYLTDRVAAVVVDGTRGPAYKMVNGVPQGTVLSPFLFACLIDKVAICLDDMSDVSASLFADDVAALALGRSADAAARLAQEVVRTLERLCPGLGLRISMPKSVFMPVGARAAKVADDMPQPQFLDGSVVPLVDTQRFLGVLFDSSLSFDGHIAEARAKFRRRLFIVRSLKDRSWGASRHLMRSVFLTFVLPCLTYCIGIVGPFLTAEHTKAIDSDLAWAARIITGCCRHTNSTKAMWEAHLDPIALIIQREAAFALERFARLPATNGHLATTGPSPAKRSWRECASQAVRAANVYRLKRQKTTRAPLCRFGAVPPWEVHAVARRLRLLPFISGLSKGLPVAKQFKLAREVISALREKWQCYTDGSLADRRGGAGVVLFRAGVPDPAATSQLSLGTCASSYRAEMAAIAHALALLGDHVAKGDSVAILTDSQSAVRKLCSGAAAATEEFEFDVWAKLRDLTISRSCRVTVQFVPGHAGIAGNELADAAAEAGRQMLCDVCRLSFSCAKCIVRAHLGKVLCGRPPAAEPYFSGDDEDGHFLQPSLGDPRITRAGEVLMSKIRVQWHPLIRTFDGGPVFTICECGKTRDFRHMLRGCRLTPDAARELLPAATPIHVLLCWHETAVLEFLVSAGHVAGPASRYVLPSAKSAAIPSVVVAAAVSAAVAQLSACGSE